MELRRADGLGCGEGRLGCAWAAAGRGAGDGKGRAGRGGKLGGVCKAWRDSGDIWRDVRRAV